MSSHDPSSSSTILPSSIASDLKGTYDVFLSFRGEDTRKGFVSHLYTALFDRGIFTFRDDKRLESGQSIAPELLKAIRDSKIGIVVFSKNYANSSWCLDELVQIVESEPEKQVIPVFYDVEPSDIRHQRNEVAKALEKHGTDGKMKSWKEALTKAANFSGYDVPKTADGNESECIRKIVADVLGKVNHRIPRTPENVVGMEYRVNKVVKMLRVGESNEVLMVGIWGMGGAGKTTIARATFDKLSHLFDGSCFLPIPVGELSEDGLKNLQKTLLSEILRFDTYISDTGHGTNTIKERLRCKKVLIVLDNVVHRKQLTAFAADNVSSFGPESRLIVTTRDIQMLGNQSSVYNVELLDDIEAMELFNRKAFPTTEPHEDFVKLSHEFVKYAKGLPLALIVLGSHLNGLTLKDWSSEIRRLGDIPNDDILNVLKISYDGLDGTDKSIFLDVACFFRSWKVNEVTEILDCFGSYYERGIRGLERKSLVYVDRHPFMEGLCIKMHDLVQEMGQNIAKGSRLWKEDEILDVLNEKQYKMGQNIAKGSRLWKANEIHDVFNGKLESEAVEAIIWINLKGRAIASFEALERMRRLRLLKILNFVDSKTRNLNMPPLPGYFSNELELLEWFEYPWCSLPKSFEGKKLSALIMQCSNIVEPIASGKKFEKLKRLDLKGSLGIKKTPDFSQIPCLEELKMSWCTNLVEVHSSFGKHQRLQLVKLGGCKNLKIFPKRLEMPSLKYLNLKSCPLYNFPEIEVPMNALEELNISDTGIKELPHSVRKLGGLQKFHLHGCKSIGAGNTGRSLKMILIVGFSTEPIADLTFVTCMSEDGRKFTLPLSFPHLTLLNLENCNLSSLTIPESCLPSLQMLSLSRNRMHGLLISEECLSSLKLLELSLIEYSVEKSVWQDFSNLNNGKMVSLIYNAPKEFNMNLSMVPYLDWETLAHKTKRGITILSEGNENSQLFLHQISGFKRNIILAPFKSWYQKRIRGFSIFLRNNCFSLRSDMVWVDFCFHRSDESVNHGKDRYYLEPKGVLFHYQPIDNPQLNSGEKQEPQEPICLFSAFIKSLGSPKEVVNDVLQWEVRLVYEDGADHEFIYENVVCEWPEHGNVVWESPEHKFMYEPVAYLQFMLSCSADFDEACSSRPDASMSCGCGEHGNVG